jgi:hypothetical protein
LLVRLNAKTQASVSARGGSSRRTSDRARDPWSSREPRRAGGSVRRADETLRTACGVLGGAVFYYVETRIAWMLCFPDSKVSLFFPPHAVLLSILLLVPTRHW